MYCNFLEYTVYVFIKTIVVIFGKYEKAIQFVIKSIQNIFINTQSKSY